MTSLRVTMPSSRPSGVCTRAALESTNRYLARELGPSQIRCNLVAAGPEMDPHV